MIGLIADIGQRLRTRAYANEAAVREGIVIPVLRELGWDPADPDQVRPEHSNEAGRADYALFSRRRQMAVLIEVKAVGRSLDGDKQLFRYCFEEGAPLAILTDGQSWNFYLPSGRGSPNERRFYSLQLNERSPAEAAEILERYLSRERVFDLSAFRRAAEDYEQAVSQREAVAALPEAWLELVNEASAAVIKALLDKAEALSGYRPSSAEAALFLRQVGGAKPYASTSSGAASSGAALQSRNQTMSEPPPPMLPANGADDRAINYVLLGEQYSAPNASRALVDILRTVVARDISKLPELGGMVRSRSRSHIAQSPEEINPARPDLARGEEIADGWLVGLTISNRDKMMIIRATCELYGLSMPVDLDLELPNS